MPKVKIFDFTTLKQQLENIICAEVHKVLESYPDVYTQRHKDMFKIVFTRTSIMFIEDELLNNDKKSFSRKFIINKYNEGIMERNSKPMIARLRGDTDKKGHICIKALEIVVNNDLIIENALFNMWDIDNWIESVLKSSARHEAGHIIDFIKSYDGKKASTLAKDNKKQHEATEEWRKWCREITDNFSRPFTDDEWRESFERYFRIPGESIADMYGNVDRNKCIEYQIKSTHYKVNVVIKTHVRKRETPPIENKTEEKEGA